MLNCQRGQEFISVLLTRSTSSQVSDQFPRITGDKANHIYVKHSCEIFLFLLFFISTVIP